MPTYEYQCPEGHLFEKFQKMTDKPRARCPVCGKQASRKISGGAGLVFKGSGFYITDYGKDGKGPRKPESEKPAAEGKSDTSAKSEAKAGPKTESKPEPKAGTGAVKPAAGKREGRAASE
jgi:putative FmdB family regulatory protein